MRGLRDAGARSYHALQRQSIEAAGATNPHLACIYDRIYIDRRVAGPDRGATPPMSQEYLTQCWNCLGEYDAVSAIWCSCNPRNPTKVCPFCLNCFCSATPEFKEQFWGAAPDDLKEDLSPLGPPNLPTGELL